MLVSASVFRRGSRRVVVPLLALAVLGFLALLAALAAQPVLAQQATAQPLPTPFDPRGGGSGPGLVGAPFLAALAVIGLGIAAVVLTALYVRLAQGK
jgi:hypothetical protein